MRYVCSNCLRCSCWLGIFMCDESRESSIYRARKKDLLKLDFEHEDWMDEESARVPRHDNKTPMIPRKVLRERMEANANA